MSTISPPTDNGWWVRWTWPVLGAILMLLPVWLLVNGSRFDWAIHPGQMPILGLTLILGGAGLAYLALPWLVQASLREPPGSQRGLLWFVLATGFLFRLLAFFSAPVLEDDYYRYMWEGGLLANGYNPSAIAPVDALNAQPGSPLSSLAAQSEPVVQRVSHKDLRSNYPPVAQIVFAVSYFISPWNLMAWKVVSLAGDLAVMALLTLLLRDAGRPVLWSTLYWWNPLIVKELANSGHMDGIVVAFTLAALLMSARGRHGVAFVALSLAIGTKLWPVLLTPLLLRPLWTKPGYALLGFGFISATTVVWLLPGYLGGSGETSFYLAYAQRWSTNSALFPIIERTVAWFLEPAGWQVWAWAASRGLLLSLLCGIAVWKSLRPVDSTTDLVTRAYTVVVALVLLSPAQFPWYMIWVLPLAAFCQMWGLLAVTATTPLYYLSFFFLAQDAYHVFTSWVVWVIWLPVWGLIALQTARSASSKTPRPPSGTKAHPT